MHKHCMQFVTRRLMRLSCSLYTSLALSVHEKNLKTMINWNQLQSMRPSLQLLIVLPDSVATVIWTWAPQRLSSARSPLGYRATHVNGYVLTTWFTVCHWPQSQEGDWARPQMCKLAWHGPWSVRKRFIRAHVWRGRWKPGCRDNRVGNNSVVDHRSRRPVLSPLHNCVDRCHVWSCWASRCKPWRWMLKDISIQWMTWHNKQLNKTLNKLIIELTEAATKNLSNIHTLSRWSTKSQWLTILTTNRQ